ncbi:asparagine synthetase domain-containing 1 [Elysia marginata]|uniref:Asparagine synthetase domain-containing 1 n=1 Tax=Elysia marginata TaxID=1093978 RepID=A0AAV4I350_9GAST|nr:asparagine synthetase domain-containing 1 [Elysia marginata]
MDALTDSGSGNQAFEAKSAEVSVQKVIQSELSQLRDKAKVYHKQPNSNIFFLSSVEKEMDRSKKALDDLTKEYQVMHGGNAK